MVVTFELEFPACYEAVARDAARTVVLEHARLDARVPEFLTGLACECADRNEHVLLATANPQRSIAVVSRVLRGPRWACRRSSAYTQWDNGEGGVLWICNTRHKVPILPSTHIHRVIVVDAHAEGVNWRRRVDAPNYLCAGELADRGHWFYDLAREPGVSVHRLDAREVLRWYPDQRRALLPLAHPEYPRAMALQDVLVRRAVLPFLAFARERVRIVTSKPMRVLSPIQRVEAEAQSGQPLVRFDALPVQVRYGAAKRLARMRGRKPRYILVKYRRGGFSRWEQAESYYTAMTRPRSQVVTIAHTQQDTKKLFEAVKVMAASDPQTPGIVGESATHLEFANGSRFFLGTAGSKGFSRGSDLARVHGSEVAYWCQGPNQVTRQQALISALEGAAEHGEIVLETTPNGSEWVRGTYEEAKKGANLWVPIFVRWFDDPVNAAPDGTFDPREILDTLSEQERDLVERHGLGTAQIAFRRAMVKTHGVLAPQEYPEDDVSAFLSSGTCYFDLQWIESTLRTLPDPDPRRRHIPGGYEVEWEPPIAGRRYVAGCDTSEGLPGADPCGVGVLDAETGAQVAAIHGWFNPAALAEHAVRISRRYNNALLGVERQNHGHAVLQRIREIGYDRPHFRGGQLYYWHEGTEIQTSRPGWDTNSRTRSVMLADLAEAVRERTMVVRDRDFVAECSAFRLQADGQWRADPAAHDDTVIKWAIAWQMRKDPPRKLTITLAKG